MNIEKYTYGFKYGGVIYTSRMKSDLENHPLAQRKNFQGDPMVSVALVDPEAFEVLTEEDGYEHVDIDSLPLAIDYRSMHTAVHGLLLFEDIKSSEEAENLLLLAEDAALNGNDLARLFELADDHIERIDYRNISTPKHDATVAPRMYYDGERTYPVINADSFDYYGV